MRGTLILLWENRCVHCTGASSSDNLFESKQLDQALKGYRTRDTEAQLAFHLWTCTQVD